MQKGALPVMASEVWTVDLFTAASDFFYSSKWGQVKLNHGLFVRAACNYTNYSYSTIVALNEYLPPMKKYILLYCWEVVFNNSI
jgi:hypothetical protein